MGRRVEDVLPAHQPDPEAWVWECIADLNTVTSGPRVHSESFSLAWDPTLSGWLRAEGVQIDVRGGSKPAVKRCAYDVVTRCLALAGTSHPDGVCTDVLLVDGPRWMPDPDRARTARYVVRVAVGCHPVLAPAGA